MPRKNRVGSVMEQWRAAHWPPKHLTRHGQLDLYYGKHDAVAELGQSLSDAMAPIAVHIVDHCGGHKPRWLAIPKIVFGVRRVNLVSTTGKASRAFTSVKQLAGFCGAVNEEVRTKMEQWLQSDCCAVMVAHKPIIDTRAYIFKGEADKPERERFLRTGLVLAVGEDFRIQDHCAQHRDKRSDALTDAFVTTESGWTIFPKIRAAKPKT